MTVPRLHIELPHIATLGFGVPATSNPHHFTVDIPRASKGRVRISEDLGMQALSNDLAVIVRVELERTRWSAIRGEVQRAFNARLAAHGLDSSAWATGQNSVDRLLGKELCILAWAVENMDAANIPIAVRNWLALRPEERWWLYGMTAMTTGGVGDSGRGWRVALRHALGDVAQHDVLKPRGRARQPRDRDTPPTLSLFDDV